MSDQDNSALGAMAGETKTPIDDGCPAFPTGSTKTEHRTLHGETYLHQEIEKGMSVRDWFAGMALQGELSAQNAESSWRPDEIARYSYDLADAMLKARAR